MLLFRIWLTRRKKKLSSDNFAILKKSCIKIDIFHGVWRLFHSKKKRIFVFVCSKFCNFFFVVTHRSENDAVELLSRQPERQVRRRAKR